MGKHANKYLVNHNNQHYLGTWITYIFVTSVNYKMFMYLACTVIKCTIKIVL